MASVQPVALLSAPGVKSLTGQRHAGGDSASRLGAAVRQPSAGEELSDPVLQQRVMLFTSKHQLHCRSDLHGSHSRLLVFPRFYRVSSGLCDNAGPNDSTCLRFVDAQLWCV
ncbi:hypothetical protein ATANTOWER_032064 [Ataeniobius toweri]|uniref:Uncharacterized protein n=1 Tax=Ataeniobius toweri TaxID=208326 RepID=A0ABU7ALJ8_9TELE|nr:hypothetical protein [Ataeniobius toweri]